MIHTLLSFILDSHIKRKFLEDSSEFMQMIEVYSNSHSFILCFFSYFPFTLVDDDTDPISRALFLACSPDSPNRSCTKPNANLMFLPSFYISLFSFSIPFLHSQTVIGSGRKREQKPARITHSKQRSGRLTACICNIKILTVLVYVITFLDTHQQKKSLDS